MKKKLLTGIKPTGELTLGNYIGALKNFASMCNNYDSYLFIADLHAITTYQKPDEIKNRILDFISIYLALGVNKETTTFFLQSDVLEHANLGYILACQAKMGEMERMTQYKDKVQKKENDSIELGLFIYPTLMAADILMYDADVIPVGDDQTQHIELTRDLAKRFNHLYGETFKLPKHFIPEAGARIMDLQDPTKKMSKSDNDKGCILLLENINSARKKIMSSVTDSDNNIKYDKENKPGISNLINILSSLTDKSIKDIELKYKDSNYGTFKKDVADVVCDFLEDLQNKFNTYRNSNEIIEILELGANKAKQEANIKLNDVKNKLGINYK